MKEKEYNVFVHMHKYIIYVWKFTEVLAMPRSSKCRRVCSEFESKAFCPNTGVEEYITLNVDELEAMRLCDLEGLEQEEAAVRMQVSRGTFQRILYSGRKKSATALCKGMGINIEGGNYEVANSHCKRYPSCEGCCYMTSRDA